MNSIGEKLRITLFGQSHAEAIGVTVEGLPAGLAIDWQRVQAFLDRRAPGRSEYSTPRRERDCLHVLCGLNEHGRTCGAPLTALFPNEDTRSGDYEILRRVPRPGHADYTAALKSGENSDLRGGGMFSGRLTAPLCLAGGIAMQYLGRLGIDVFGRIARLAGIADAPQDYECPQRPADPAFPVLEAARGAAMKTAIAQARSEGDSVGGVIEVCAVGVPGGLGDPMFGGVENRMSACLFGIPAVRGVEFGAGFGAADMRGSEHNDPFQWENGAVRTRGNRHGGVLGGITTGMPLVVRIAVKPTPSIAREQITLDRNTCQPVPFSVPGRHDPCIVPRAVPAAEAAVALTLMDMLLEENYGAERDPRTDR